MANAPDFPPQSDERYWVVMPGETLEDIAAKHGVTADEILAINDIPDPEHLADRRRLRIPSSAGPGKDNSNIAAQMNVNAVNDFDYNQAASKTGPVDDIAGASDDAEVTQVLPDFSLIEILDQGADPTSVGFALAGAVNYFNHRRGRRENVSPLMIYDLARQRDEFPDDSGGGTSLRAGIDVLLNEGVCTDSLWQGSTTEEVLSSASRSRLARAEKLGTTEELKAAIRLQGVAVAASHVSENWMKDDDGVIRIWREPEPGRGIHPFAVVGYTPEGFIVQNSWGLSWGGPEIDGARRPGFAIWSYEDAGQHMVEAWALEPRQARGSATWEVPYDADLASGETDLLEIDTDVHALASIIAAWRVTPPLSIGLFGNWGSGKSFFMNALKRRVAALARGARQSEQMQKDVAFYKRIIQIDFNAWHYVQSPDLWAGLVQRILDGLKFGDEEPDVVEELRKFWLKELAARQTALGQAEAAQTQAAEAVRTAEGELETLKQKIQEQTEGLAGLKQAAEDVWLSVILPEDLKTEVRDLAKEVGVDRTTVSAKDLEKALSEARATMQRGNALLTPLLRARDRGRRRLMLAGVLVAPVVVATGVEAAAALLKVDVVAAVAVALSSSLTALLGLGTTWLTSGARWLSGWLEKADQAQHRLDDKAAERRAEQAAEIATKQAEFDRTQTEYAAKLQERDAQQKLVQEAQAELEAATATQMMARYIQDRAESTDYRKHLGLLALVRQDFEHMSDLVTKQNRQVLEGFKTLDEEKQQEAVRINRIVLYIDDLDRCPPDKVVQVLQAVHLLGSFSLFVIVVAVDSRWVTRSLQAHYKTILSDEDDDFDAPSPTGFGEEATPYDYLEKVFQIPFWIRPLMKEGRESMLRGLLKEVRTGAPTQTRSQTGNADTADGQQGQGDGQPNADGSLVDEAPDVLLPREAGPDSTRELDLDPAGLHMRASELAFMEQLSPLLGNSPRALKRFVNIYRLIKACVPVEEQDDFVRDVGPETPYQVVLFLLALVTGTRTLSLPLFQALADKKREAADATVPNSNPASLSMLTAGLTTGEGNFRIDPDEQATLRRWIVEQTDDWEQADIGLFAEWAPRIARFSFRVESMI